MVLLVFYLEQPLLDGTVKDGIPVFVLAAFCNAKGIKLVEFVVLHVLTFFSSKDVLQLVACQAYACLLNDNYGFDDVVLYIHVSMVVDCVSLTVQNPAAPGNGPMLQTGCGLSDNGAVP